MVLGDQLFARLHSMRAESLDAASVGSQALLPADPPSPPDDFRPNHHKGMLVRDGPRIDDDEEGPFEGGAWWFGDAVMFFVCKVKDGSAGSSWLFCSTMLTGQLDKQRHQVLPGSMTFYPVATRHPLGALICFIDYPKSP